LPLYSKKPQVTLYVACGFFAVYPNKEKSL